MAGTERKKKTIVIIAPDSDSAYEYHQRIKPSNENSNVYHYCTGPFDEVHVIGNPKIITDQSGYAKV